MRNELWTIELRWLEDLNARSSIEGILYRLNDGAMFQWYAVREF